MAQIEPKVITDKQRAVSVKDYRALLKRYIKHVEDYEGTTFIDAGYGQTQLSDDDREELRRVWEDQCE